MCSWLAVKIQKWFSKDSSSSGAGGSAAVGSGAGSDVDSH